MISPPNENGEVRHNPETFKMGRTFMTQSKRVEANLFTALTTAEEEVDQQGISISALPKNISEYDLCAYLQASQQVLYNQSYTARNEEVNSGIFRSTTKSGDMAGTILVSLEELCRRAYGVDEATTDQRRKMEALIDRVHKHEVEIMLPDGRKVSKVLIAKLDKYSTKENGAVGYQLVLNPVFCGEHVLKSYGEFPQDVTKRLRLAAQKMAKERGARRVTITAPYLRLVQLLGRQDKRYPFPIALDNLLNHLGLSKTYRKDKLRVEKQLANMFWILQEIGLLRTDTAPNPVEGTTEDGTKKFTFHLNPNWTRNPQNLLPEEAPSGDNLEPI